MPKANPLLLAVRWLDPEAAKATDEIPLSWFSNEGVRRGLSHRVREKGHSGVEAWCDVYVEGTAATIDYTPYNTENNPSEVLPGYLRLTFTDTRRNEVLRIDWRDRSTDKFTKAKVSFDLIPAQPAANNNAESAAQLGNAHKLTRIAYNTEKWMKPSGDAASIESSGSHNAINGFGHEEWLFRSDWIIDGWRYAFIQGLNRHRLRYVGKPLNVTLYTIQPDKRRRVVATIYSLESLSDEQAKDAIAAFKKRGWLDTMKSEVAAIGGKVDSLGDSKWAPNILNIRFRLENLDISPPNTFLTDDDWIRERHRYILYTLQLKDVDRIERSQPSRSGSQSTPEVRKLFRRGTKSIEYTPEHDKMQAKLMEELQLEYGRENVWREQDFVDVRVETEKELLYFEIKTDVEPRTVIRHALGQILEYAYHPTRSGRRPDQLVIVGQAPLGAHDQAYIDHLRTELRLPLSYRAVSI